MKPLKPWSSRSNRSNPDPTTLVQLGVAAEGCGVETLKVHLNPKPSNAGSLEPQTAPKSPELLGAR